MENLMFWQRDIVITLNAQLARKPTCRINEKRSAGKRDVPVRRPDIYVSRQHKDRP